MGCEQIVEYRTCAILEVLMKRWSSWLMAALMVAALFWGNCLSCPKMLLAGSHSCCKHSKPISGQRCDRHLQQFVKSDSAPQTAAVPMVAALPVAVETAPPAVASEPRVAEYSGSPPERIALISSLRI